MSTKRRAERQYRQLQRWINAQAEVKAKRQGMSYGEALKMLKEQNPKLFERYAQAWGNYKVRK